MKSVLRKIGFILCIFFIQQGVLFAQTQKDNQDDDIQGIPELTLKADHLEVRVGDTVTISIVAEYTQDYSLVGSLGFPVVPGLEPFGMSLNSRKEINTSSVMDLTRTFNATTKGKFSITPVMAQFRTSDGKVMEIKSNGLTVIVLPKDAPEEGLRDIKAIRPVRKPVNWALLGGIGAAALLAFVIAGQILKRAHRPGGTATPIFRFSSIEDEYIEKLMELGVPEEYDSLAVKKLYVEMSDIVRSYLEVKYGIEAREATSREVLDSIKKAGLPQKSLEMYSGLAKTLDIVKYAKGRPFKEDISLAREACIDFIRHIGSQRR